MMDVLSPIHKNSKLQYQGQPEAESELWGLLAAYCEPHACFLSYVAGVQPFKNKLEL